LLLHAGNDAVPHQLIIRSTKGNNGLTTLLFGTTLFTMKSPLFALESVEIHKGIRILKPALHQLYEIHQVISLQICILKFKNKS
jgi:hypothetical protein